MKTFKLLLLLGLSICFGCKKEKNSNTISYIISPITIENQSMLRINISYQAEEDGETSFLFLNDTWGEKELHNTIHSIQSLDKTSKIEILKDSGWVTIKHPKHIKTVNLEYIIKQDTKGDLTTKDTYRPVIQPNYFHVFAHSLLMIPLEYSENKTSRFDARIKWEGFPDDYTIQNSFGTNNHYQQLTNITEGDLIESVFIGGDYRSYKLNINDNTVVFSTRDTWKVFKDSTMLNILDKTITAQRDFWNDHSQPYFSVNLTPTVQERGSSFQGTGLTNSFDCSATNNDDLEIEGLVYLFNHELMHNWIGNRIKNDNEEAQYWFSEGFTDYYTCKNIAKYAIFNLNESYYIDKINETINLLYTSPVRNAPNSDINYENFWESIDYEKLPYRRGALFAFYLDHKIKQDSQGKLSLDNLMLAIKDDAVNSNQKITHDYFIKKTNAFLKADISVFFNTHIEKGQLFNLEKIFNDLGLEYNPTSKVFDLGFTISEDKKSILSVDETTEAYKAGLRAGDLLKSRSYYHNSTKHEAQFTVVRNGKTLDIKYYPTRDADIPQLKNNTYNIGVLKL